MLHWATPVLPHTKLLWRMATFMTSQRAVFVNPFVTSQRALSDNPIDDVKDSTVLNARQPRRPTSGAASSIEHNEIGTICLECWRQIFNLGEVIDRDHDIRIMWGMYASLYHICDVKRGYVSNWILVFDHRHNLVITQESRFLMLLNLTNIWCMLTVRDSLWFVLHIAFYLLCCRFGTFVQSILCIRHMAITLLSLILCSIFALFILSLFLLPHIMLFSSRNWSILLMPSPNLRQWIVILLA